MSSDTLAAQAAPVPVSKEDHNALLISLCVKVLKEITPNGMTTKEMSAALDTAGKNVAGFEGISSSILSSKLNSFFKKLHGDSSSPTWSQLSDLPLTRAVSADVPKRLVYRYTPPGATPHSPSSPQTPRSPVYKGKGKTRPQPELNTHEPVTPPAEPEPEVVSRKRPAALLESAKKRPNPYYDLLEEHMLIPVMCAGEAPRWAMDIGEEYEPPEALTPEKLELMF